MLTDKPTNPVTKARAERLPEMPPLETIFEICQAGGDDARGDFAARDRALIEVLYGCGLRVGEACGLDLDDYYHDDQGPLLRIRHTKTGRERRIPVPHKAQEALEAWIRARRRLIGRRSPERALILSQRRKRLTTDGARYIVRRIGVRVAGYPVRPHMLRHAIATHLLEAEAPLPHIATFLGHQSLRSTQVYTHVAVDLMTRVYDQYHPKGFAAPSPQPFCPEE